jgi:hypothetical protein
MGAKKGHDDMMKHIARRTLAPFAPAIVALMAEVFLPTGSGAGQSVDQFTPVSASPVAARACPRNRRQIPRRL